MLTIHPYIENMNYNDEPWVSLPVQLQAYLAKLDQHSHLQRLSRLDPYEDQRFSGNELDEMLNDIKLLQKEVVLRSIEQPPYYVSESPVNRKT